MKTARSKIIGRLIQEFDLDLKGLKVATEAATGPFAFTASIAAKAGGEVWALAKNSRFGNSDAAIRESRAAARRFRAIQEVRFVKRRDQIPWENIDIVTNSGHLRPLNSGIIDRLSDRAVITLMMEPWEVRGKDVDFRSARRKGIALAGVNEGGRKVRLFQELGPLLVKICRDATIGLRGKSVYLFASPQFRPHLEKEIRKKKAKVSRFPQNANLAVIATGPRISVATRAYRDLPRGIPVIQIWGDVRRRKDLKWFPTRMPPSGHMGYRLDELGPEPAWRLIAAGLKVGEILSRSRSRRKSVRESIRRAVASGFALNPFE